MGEIVSVKWSKDYARPKEAVELLILTEGLEGRPLSVRILEPSTKWSAPMKPTKVQGPLTVLRWKAHYHQGQMGDCTVIAKVTIGSGRSVWTQFSNELKVLRPHASGPGIWLDANGRLLRFVSINQPLKLAIRTKHCENIKVQFQIYTVPDGNLISPWLDSKKEGDIAYADYNFKRAQQWDAVSFRFRVRTEYGDLILESSNLLALKPRDFIRNSVVPSIANEFKKRIDTLNQDYVLDAVMEQRAEIRKVILENIKQEERKDESDLVSAGTFLLLKEFENALYNYGLFELGYLSDGGLAYDHKSIFKIVEPGIGNRSDVWKDCKKVLLFFPGWMGDASNSFMGIDNFAQTEEYDLCLGFNCKSLTKDPFESAFKLYTKFPKNKRIDVDMVCYSRGGLVARSFIEQILPRDSLIRPGKVIFHGTPNHGTPLAQPSVFRHFANRVASGFPNTAIIDSFIELSSAISHDLRGFGSFDFFSDYIKNLNAPTPLPIGTSYYTVSANFKTVLDEMTGNLFIGPDNEELENDYVVPVDSVHAIKTQSLHQVSPLLGYDGLVNESAGDSKELFERGHILHFKMKRGVSHHDFFKQPETSENIRKILGVRT